MAMSERVEARINGAKALFPEFDAEIGEWVKTKEVAERGQAYLNELERPSWKREPFAPVPPDNAKVILRRIADELTAAIDEYLAAGQLEPETVAAIKAFQAGDGGEFSAFLKTITDPDNYSLRAIISEQFVVEDGLIRGADGHTTRFPVGAYRKTTLNVSTNPGGSVVEYLHALIAELSDLLDAGDS